jgi:hypothetical protein
MSSQKNNSLSKYVIFKLSKKFLSHSSDSQMMYLDFFSSSKVLMENSQTFQSGADKNVKVFELFKLLNL